MRAFFKSIIAGAVIAIGVAAASAANLSPGAKPAAEGAPIVQVHGCHFDCQFSPRFGWHNHSNAECRPEPCRERQRGGGGYDGGGGDRGYGGGHPCHYDCRFSPGLGWHNHSNAQCRPEACRR